MNTPARNDKNIEKMKRLKRVYNDSEEDKVKENQARIALENSTREYPFPTARRFAAVTCVALWLFCVVGLFFGVDLRGIFPFIFLTLAVLVILYLPMFWLKRKIFDVIIGAAFAAGCIGLALSMVS
jgi:uncharacterized membrane protein YjjP (DUF1212 family)